MRSWKSYIHHRMKFCLFKFDRGVLSTWSNLIIAQSCGDTDWVCHNDKKENIKSSLCDKTVYIAKWRKWLYLLQNSFEWKQLENLKSKTYNHSRLVSHTLYPGSLSCSLKTLFKSQYQNWVWCWEILMDWTTWGRCWGLTGAWQWQSCRQSSVILSPGSSLEGRSVWERSSTLSSTSQTGQSDGPWPGTVEISWGLYHGPPSSDQSSLLQSPAPLSGERVQCHTSTLWSGRTLLGSRYSWGHFSK